MGDINGHFIQWINDRAEPGESFVSSSAGKIAYRIDIPVVDTLGLNDIDMARSKPPSFGSDMAGHE